MTRNFKILAKESRNQFLTLQLYGDFDASSACELINFLDESVKKSRKVTIDTDGLRTINDFGLEVFLPRLIQPNSAWPDIEMTGRFSGIFREE